MLEQSASMIFFLKSPKNKNESPVNLPEIYN